MMGSLSPPDLAVLTPPPPGPRRGRQLALRGPSGHVREHVRAIGPMTPDLLFRGSELYVHSGFEGVMDVVRPGELAVAKLVRAGAEIRRQQAALAARKRVERRARESRFQGSERSGAEILSPDR